MLTCVSSKTRFHDVVGVSGEAKMESSQGMKQRGISKVARGLFPEKGDRIDWPSFPKGQDVL
jgi:hypothetical protein